MEKDVSQMQQVSGLNNRTRVMSDGVLVPKKTAYANTLIDNFSTSAFPRLLKIERQKACAFVDIRQGAAGAFDVVKQMKMLVRTASVNDAGLERWAVRVFLTDNDFDSHTQPEYVLKAVFDFVVKYIKYVSDVKGIENIKDARQTLSDGFGDCDDIAILIASILSVLGFEPEFVLARTPRLIKTNQESAYTPVLPKDFNHVYVRVILPSGVFYMDATLELAEFNVEANSVRNKVYIKIWNDGADSFIEGFAGIGDFFKGILKVASPIVGAIPVVGSFAKVGLDALNAAVNRPVISFSELATETNKVLDSLIIAVRDKGADYSEAVRQGEAVVNNFIGLKNNKGKKNEAQQNEVLLNSVTAKLNQLRGLLDLYNARLNAKATGAANNTATDTNNVSMIDGIDNTYLVYGGLALGAVALYFIFNKK